MSVSTPDQLTKAHEAEMRPGMDSYGDDVGHWIMPNESLIAIHQADDQLAHSLITQAAKEQLQCPATTH